MKVGTTLCHTLAGSAAEKSSENKSSFLLAIGASGTGGNSAARMAEVMKTQARVASRRVFMSVTVGYRVKGRGRAERPTKMVRWKSIKPTSDTPRELRTGENGSKLHFTCLIQIPRL
jgi:hypothetical protein